HPGRVVFSHQRIALTPGEPDARVRVPTIRFRHKPATLARMRQAVAKTVARTSRKAQETRPVTGSAVLRWRSRSIRSANYAAKPSAEGSQRTQGAERRRDVFNRLAR